MKKIVLLLLMFISIGVSAACTPQEETGLNTVRYIAVDIYDPVFVGVEEGIFERNGIDLVISGNVQAGVTAIQLVSSGDVEASLSSLMGIINAVYNGLDIIAVSDLQSTTEGAPLKEFYVRQDSDINTVEDVVGKTIAVNGLGNSFHYAWLMKLSEFGLTEDDVNFVSLPFPEQIIALENGSIDVASLISPHNAVGRQNENFRMLFDGLDVFGVKQFSAHFISTEWAEQNPKVATAFVTAMAETIEFIQNNQDRAREIISNQTGVDVSFIDDYFYQPNGMMILEDVQFWIDFMYEYEGFTRRLEAEEVATNEYNSKLD